MAHFSQTSHKIPNTFKHTDSHQLFFTYKNSNTPAQECKTCLFSSADGKVFRFLPHFFLFHNWKRARSEKLDKICHHRLLLYCAAVNCDVTSVQELIRLE
jgi:hypothetical protein